MDNADGKEQATRRKPVPEAVKSLRDNGSSIPQIFAASVVLSVAVLHWPLRWVMSGAPVLVYSILLGKAKGYRVLPYIPLWTIFTTINLVYVVAATSWLLYWVFAVICYVSILLSCLFQFNMAAMFARRRFRHLLRDLHFIQDTISFFNLPALEIDTDVSGLMVIRGFTFSLSTLTGTAHGIEVGLKLSDDLELAIQAETCVVSLFRKIEIGDVYCNIKGGEYEMNFGKLKPGPLARPGEDFISTDTAILKAAAAAATLVGSGGVKSDLTVGEPPEDMPGTKNAKKNIIQLSPDEDTARERYEEKIRHIHKTSTINVAINTLKKAAREDEANNNLDTPSNLRAAVCTHIHNQPTIPHPPSRSIRLSTLRHTDFPRFKVFLHRLPFLLRALLSPISYFHPVHIDNITAAGSGKWMVSLMQEYFFKHYPGQDGEIRRLQTRISAWLADANFAVELGEVHCRTHVPINTTYDIENIFKIGDLMAYRTLPEAVNLTQVVRLGGADATIAFPSYLLPHHGHLLPKKPTEFDEMNLEQEVIEADGTPNTVKKERELEQLRKDETNMKISAHAHLPAVFDQALLNFVAALVKATKIIEIERGHEELVLKRAETLGLANGLRRTDSVAFADNISIASTEDTDSSTSTLHPGSQKSFNNFMRKMDRGFRDMNVNMKDGMRKAGINTVNVVANDRWIARIVGNIMRKMEKTQGDVGYSGLIPIKLAYYRDRVEPETKLLP
ncbi:hypothetical protein K504DRAFT_463589 [Pleomassaria siparia CBS 279.74]|uniref:Uncharacterized protein n=1 Tax=Pleomassaria siparia CBS 279.74 TaxID=1314801 RepID=A0A6G1JSE8_9PLEO|nr:hypothetical protein K504DRAFT_463589 [Pleomassaria siparia CBS 279.74]